MKKLSSIYQEKTAIDVRKLFNKKEKSFNLPFDDKEKAKDFLKNFSKSKPLKNLKDSLSWKKSGAGYVVTVAWSGGLGKYFLDISFLLTQLYNHAMMITSKNN